MQRSRAYRATWRATASVLTLVLGVALPAATHAQTSDEDGWDDPSDAVGFGSTPSDGGDAAGWDDPDDAAGFGSSDDNAGFGDGDDAAGFGETSGDSNVAPSSSSSAPDSAGSLVAKGFLRSRVGLWAERFDDNPLAKARQSADVDVRYQWRGQAGDTAVGLRLVGAVHLEYDAAYLIDRERFDEATLDAYESQIIGGETFAALSLGPLELTAGRQIVAWGHGNLLSPVDVVNPRDNREPGLSDLDDIRLAVLATRAGLFLGAHRLEAMVVHESFFGLRPAPLSEFSPLRAMITEDPTIAPIIEGRTLRYSSVPDRFATGASQYFGRWSYNGSVDLSFYAASVLDKQGVTTLPAGANRVDNTITIPLYHPRYTLVGHSGAMPAGNFVVRWEAAAELDRPFLGTDVANETFNLEILERDQVIGMLGFTYAGIDNGQIDIEAQQAYVFDNPDRDGTSLQLLVPAEQPYFAAQYTQSFLRETLRITVVGTVFGATTFLGALGRAEISYDVRDDWQLGLGYVTYLPAKETIGPLYGLTTHDRIFASLRYDFLLP